MEKVADLLILIDNGEILLKEEKDILLDKYRKIKGDIALLDEPCKKLFLNLHTTEYGFIGITSRVEEVQRNMKSIILERPTIEEIMLAYIERRKSDVYSFA